MLQSFHSKASVKVWHQNSANSNLEMCDVFHQCATTCRSACPKNEKLLSLLTNAIQMTYPCTFLPWIQLRYVEVFFLEQSSSHSCASRQKHAKTKSASDPYKFDGSLISKGGTLHQSFSAFFSDLPSVSKFKSFVSHANKHDQPDL